MSLKDTSGESSETNPLGTFPGGSVSKSMNGDVWADTPVPASATIAPETIKFFMDTPSKASLPTWLRQNGHTLW